MNYEKVIKQFLLLERAGYTMGTCGLGLVVYGVIQKDSSSITMGLGNIMSGTTVAYSSRVIQQETRETKQILTP